MDRIEFVYTLGMSNEEVETYLKRIGTGVLSLASDDDAYAIPVAHHYEDETLYVRLSTDGSSTKQSYLEETETACLTLYDVDPPRESWSVVVTGSLRQLDNPEREGFDAATVNDSFLELRVFDEDIEAIDLKLYEFEIDTITGRKTGT
ncbi:pyridoxamine 5'-phosphate oxidase family protein [Halobacteria archaeon AArc-dxtr1]|nr:pyridoxamine 5'-phosphate oxidase family protein [Halobacteria archaeon AArc-dxtr1]